MVEDVLVIGIIMGVALILNEILIQNRALKKIVKELELTLEQEKLELELLRNEFDSLVDEYDNLIKS